MEGVLLPHTSCNKMALWESDRRTTSSELARKLADVQTPRELKVSSSPTLVEAATTTSLWIYDSKIQKAFKSYMKYFPTDVSGDGKKMVLSNSSC